MTQDFKIALEEYRKQMNIAGIDRLWESQSAGASAETKELFIEAYSDIYGMLSYDLACMRFEDERGVSEDLLELLRTIERIDPNSVYLNELGASYERLADFTLDEDEKLKLLSQAIVEHKKYQQNSGQHREHRVAEVMFEEMKIRRQYPTADLDQIFQLMNLAFKEYRNEVLWAFSHVCFGLLELPEKIAKPYFDQFFTAIQSMLTEHAKTNVLVYYDWEKILGNYHSKPYIGETENTRIADEKIHALEQLRNYATTDHEILNNLGSAFARSARFLTGAQQLEYYEVAVDYFLQATQIQYLAWPYPVYAANTLKEMAHIYFDHGDKAKALETFQHAERVFDESDLPDFNFNSHCAEFLMDFARTMYDFKNDELLNKAKEKFLLTKKIGNNCYSSPFFGLALIHLKQGYTEACLQELRECDEVFKPIGTQLQPLLEDEAFKSVWPEIEKLIHAKS